MTVQECMVIWKKLYDKKRLWLWPKRSLKAVLAAKVVHINSRYCPDPKQKGYRCSICGCLIRKEQEI